MSMPCENLREFTSKFIENVCDYTTEEAREFFKIYEIELAKALMLDFPKESPRVAKIILALKDMDKINIKIE